MKTLLSKSLMFAVIAAVSGTTAAAQPKTQSTHQPATSTQRPAKRAHQRAKLPAVEPEAIAALGQMGDFLRQQQSFSVRTTTQTDYVLRSGQKVQRIGHGDLLVRRPDHLRADVVSDNKQRQFFYDGKTFTLFSPKLGYYSTLQAPHTINELADLLQTQYGLELPLIDLFRWGSRPGTFDQITAAHYLGPTTINGVTVDQYAFRQPGLDWQIWIQRGPEPLPRKLLLTTTDDKARPEFAVEMRWQLGTEHDDRVFAFVPPQGAKQIAMADVAKQRAQARMSRRSTRSVPR